MTESEERKMIHLGDITKINGAEIEPVDCITAGSPCQDLSVAGKRAGLEGERSGLFMEQIRIIKEMREHDRNNGRTDEHIRPRYMVWENVPGAFSSNKGEDFRAVLEETAKVAEGDACIPRLEKWPHAGCIMGDGWSLAWRLHDAQFWGVPQRRKRIALVADFGGDTAPEILFERKGLSGDFAESGTQGERTAGTAEKGTDSTIGFNRERNGAVTANGIMPTLQAAAGESGNNKPADTSRTLDLNGGSPACNQGGMCVLQSAGFDGNMGSKAGNIGYEEEMSPTLKSGGKMHVVTCLNDQGGSVMGVSENVVGALRAQEHGHQPLVFEPGAASRVGGHVYEDDVAGTVRANAGDNQQAVVYSIGSYDSGGMKSDNPHSGIYEADTSRTLDLNGGSPACNQGGMAVVCLEGNGSRPSHKGDGYAESETMYILNSTEHHAVAVENHPNDSRVKISEDGMAQTLSSRMGTGGGNVPMVMELYQNTTGTLSPGAHAGSYNGQDAYNDMLISAPVVRRLTPLECERLQGFPDGWTDIGEWVDSKGKKHKESDSPRYKALGNSIAVGYANNGSGFWMWLLKRISAQYERNATLGSLFDGIGGFPLAWEHFNGKGTARWASEIEEFPIAVTKHWFG